MKHYSYNGHIYEFICECRMKHPDLGKWITAVMYSRDGTTYCREFADFFIKFKLVDL